MTPTAGKLRRWSLAARRYAAPLDIFESFRPLLHVFLLMGIMPYRMVDIDGGGHRLRPSVGGGLLTVAYICAFVYAYVQTILEMRNMFLANLKPDDFSRAVDLYMLTSSLAAVLCMLFVCVRRRTRMCRLLNLLDMVDRRLQKLGGRVEHRRTLCSMCGLMAFSWLVYGIYLTGSYLVLVYVRHRNSPVCWMAFFMPHIMLFNFLYKWRMVVMMLHQRLEVLNKVSSCCVQRVNR